MCVGPLLVMIPMLLLDAEEDFEDDEVGPHVDVLLSQGQKRFWVSLVTPAGDTAWFLIIVPTGQVAFGLTVNEIIGDWPLLLMGRFLQRIDEPTTLHCDG